MRFTAITFLITAFLQAALVASQVDQFEAQATAIILKQHHDHARPTDHVLHEPQQRSENSSASGSSGSGSSGGESSESISSGSSHKSGTSGTTSSKESQTAHHIYYNNFASGFGTTSMLGISVLNFVVVVMYAMM